METIDIHEAKELLDSGKIIETKGGVPVLAVDEYDRKGVKTVVEKQLPPLATMQETRTKTQADLDALDALIAIHPDNKK